MREKARTKLDVLIAKAHAAIERVELATMSDADRADLEVLNAGGDPWWPATAPIETQRKVTERS